VNDVAGRRGLRRRFRVDGFFDVVHVDGLTSRCKVPVADCRNLTRKSVLTRGMEDASDIVVGMRKI